MLLENKIRSLVTLGLTPDEVIDQLSEAGIIAVDSKSSLRAVASDLDLTIRSKGLNISQISFTNSDVHEFTYSPSVEDESHIADSFSVVAFSSEDKVRALGIILLLESGLIKEGDLEYTDDVVDQDLFHDFISLGVTETLED